MNILLINPPIQNGIKTLEYLKSADMGNFPSLGLLYIASVLKEDYSLNVKFLDLCFENKSINDLFSVFNSFNPALVGITAYTDNLYTLKLIVDYFKDKSPKTFIVLGGAHVNIYPEETLKNFRINCVIKGDGEYSFKKLAYAIQKNQQWRNIPGVCYLEDGLIKSNLAEQISDLDILPFLDRNLYAIYKTRSSVTIDFSPIATMISSRGCPFQCSFCSSFYKVYRKRSISNVIMEIQKIYDEYKIERFFFFDDLFNISKKRLIEFCNALNQLTFKVSWSFRGRINELDEATIFLLKKSGCCRIHFGVESGVQRLLDIYQKQLTLEQIKKIFKLCNAAGIETVANFVLGAPSETYLEIMQTIKFSFEITPTYVEYHILIPYPNTKIYNEMLQKGDLEFDIWRTLTNNPNLNFKPPFCSVFVTEKQLQNIIKKAYLKFYFNPRHIYRNLIKVKNAQELLKKIRGAYKLLKALNR